MGKIDHFTTGHFYHVYNKSLEMLTPFKEDKNNWHLINLFWYYRSFINKLSFFDYKKIPEIIRLQLIKKIDDPINFQVEILAFCIMKNHYHILLRQNTKFGIHRFMSNIINAFTRHYNILNERLGPIFLPRFKSRLIHTEEQLIHVSRYIHLNPYSSGVVNSMDKLYKYPFSSLREYLEKSSITNTSFILDSGYFLGNKNKYKLFIVNQADYQKSLEHIKHVEKWS